MKNEQGKYIIEANDVKDQFIDAKLNTDDPEVVITENLYCKPRKRSKEELEEACCYVESMGNLKNAIDVTC
jgi:hypothetical protein